MDSPPPEYSRALSPFKPATLCRQKGEPVELIKSRPLPLWSFQTWTSSPSTASTVPPLSVKTPSLLFNHRSRPEMVAGAPDDTERVTGLLVELGSNTLNVMTRVGVCGVAR